MNGKHNVKLNWKRILRGTGICAVMTLLMAALFAELMNRNVISIDHINYLAMISIACGCVSGSLSTGKGREAWMEMLLAGVVWFLILVGINALVFDCQLSGILPVLVLILGSSVLPLVLKKPMTYRKYKPSRKGRYV